jgi:adenylate cyclase
MAFFGAPKELENSAINAMDAAQSKLEKLHALNKVFEKQGLPNIKIGIGLHIGDAVVGNIGSEKRNEYTAIGDVVNTASRLEGLTKQAGYPVVVSSDVVDALPKEMIFDDLGKMSVKGRAPVSVFGWPAKKLVSKINSEES